MMSENEHKGAPWGKIIGIGCLVLLLLGIAAGAGCYFFMKWGVKEVQKQEVPKLVNQVRASLRGSDMEADAEAEFEKILGLAREGKIGMMPFGGFQAKVQKAQEDGEIDSAEGANILEYIKEINAGDGDAAMPTDL